ncbi:hypothetical protein OG21DRAFT_1244458 [Imleria badia]|nr:hypothetical protein OG21DRAFT_1244458 [Imleria badia]
MLLFRLSDYTLLVLAVVGSACPLAYRAFLLGSAWGRIGSGPSRPAAAPGILLGWSALGATAPLTLLEPDTCDGDVPIHDSCSCPVWPPLISRRPPF